MEVQTISNGQLSADSKRQRWLVAEPEIKKILQIMEDTGYSRLMGDDEEATIETLMPVARSARKQREDDFRAKNRS